MNQPANRPASRLGSPLENAAPHPALAPRRRSLWPVFVMPLLLLVAAAAWSAFWFYSANRAETLIDGWRAREAKSGRVFECGSRSVGGFPFRIEVRCGNASASLTSTQPPMALRLGDLVVVGQVYDPTRLIAEFKAPMTVAESSQPPSLNATWTLGQASLRGLPEVPQRASLSFDELALDRLAAPAPQPLFRANHAEFHGRLAEGSVTERPVIELVTQLVAASAPSLHPLLAQPFNADLTAKASGLHDFSPKPWPDRFRDIQAAGGRIDIVSSRIAQGDLIAVAAGQLGLSAQGRLNGELRMTVVGIERVMPALGLDKLLAQGVSQSTVDRFAPGVNARDVNNVLSSLDKLIPGLGNLARERAGNVAAAGIATLGEPATLEGKKAIALPLRFVDGAVFIGPLQVGQTPALF